MKDLTKLNKEVKKVFEKFGINDPAFIIAFTVEPDRKMVHWVSSTSRHDSITILESLAERMKSQLQ